METGNMMEKLNAIPEEVITLLKDTLSFCPNVKLAECFPMTFFRAVEAEEKTYQMEVIIKMKEVK